VKEANSFQGYLANADTYRAIAK